MVSGLWQPTRGILQPNRHWRRPQGGAAATVAFVASAVDPANLTTYSFTIGTAPADGYAVALVCCDGTNATISSSTIGGSSATTVVSTNVAGGSAAGLIILQVSSGGSVDVGVTWNTGQSRAGAAVWLITGLSSSTAAHTYSINNDTTPNFSVDVPASGVLIVGGLGANGTTPGTLSEVTKDVDRILESSTHDMIAGSKAYSAAQTSLAVDMTPGGTPNRTPAIAASWGP